MVSTSYAMSKQNEDRHLGSRQEAEQPQLNPKTLSKRRMDGKFLLASHSGPEKPSSCSGERLRSHIIELVPSAIER